MRLTTDADAPIDQPTADDIRRVVSFANHPQRTFAILENQAGCYLQVMIDDHWNYQLEYQEGTTEQHYETYVIEDLDEVVQAFLSYLRGDGTWRQRFEWKKMNL